MYARDRQLRFATFPDTLVVHAKKFQLVNWVPTKLGACLPYSDMASNSSNFASDIPIILPDGDVLTFDQHHLGRGLQPGETELQEDNVPTGMSCPISSLP